MPKLSAGLLLYRVTDGVVEVLLGHPGGPFWVRRDEGAWSIPKGEYAPDEDPWAAAQREFTEELGAPVPPGEPLRLEPVKQAGGKIVTVFAVRGDLDPDTAASNTFTLEWPRGSGTLREFREIDRVAWFPAEEARAKLLAGQRPVLDQLTVAVAAGRG